MNLSYFTQKWSLWRCCSECIYFLSADKRQALLKCKSVSLEEELMGARSSCDWMKCVSKQRCRRHKPCTLHTWKWIGEMERVLLCRKERILSFQLSSCWSSGSYLSSFAFVAWQPDLYCKEALEVTFGVSGSKFQESTPIFFFP